MIASSNAAETIVQCRLTTQNPAARTSIIQGRVHCRTYLSSWTSECRPIHETNNTISKTMHQNGILTLPGAHRQCWRMGDDKPGGFTRRGPSMDGS